MLSQSASPASAGGGDTFVAEGDATRSAASDLGAGAAAGAADSGAVGATGGGNPAQLAHGISIALYNTAFGLIVAIPALIFWRYFRSRVDAYLLTLELASEQFVRHINRLRK